MTSTLLQQAVEQLKRPEGDWSLSAALSAMNEARHLVESALQQQPEPVATWRCFHCDEVFTNVDDATNHFGPAIYSDPACAIDAARLRELETELTRHREEDTDLHRHIYGLQSAHQVALQREEEKGYARGLRDGANLSAESTERAALQQQEEPREVLTGFYISGPYPDGNYSICELASGRVLQLLGEDDFPQPLRDAAKARSDKDYAIEHAGYMATAAKDYMMAVGAEGIARMDDESEGTDETAEKWNEATNDMREAGGTLSNRIYEFEKRRDRAASPSPQDFTLPMVEEGKGTDGGRAFHPCSFCTTADACGRRGCADAARGREIAAGVGGTDGR